MLVYGIPSYKLEKTVVQAEIDIIEQMGVEIKTGIEVGKDISLDELRAQGYKAFYIAIGCQGGRKAGVPGEDAEGVMTAVDFLREVNARETFPLEGDVVVIGGGNVAIDVARNSTRCGEGSVSMYCLESRTEMPASEEEIEEELPLLRRKSFSLKPMAVEEAILQMNLLEHQFFVFSDADSGKVGVVYKRHDQGYGLILPE